ncbi:hypothetical protein, partial [Hyphomonas sp. UBA1472]|uniref:hypothetical protein n=2 Tax=unclassified Hyphomonas TaxID=2630699 RepID=UPI0025BAA055
QLRNNLFRRGSLAHVSAPYLKPVLTQIMDHFSGSRPRESGDDVAHQTAITNGEAHVQRYGLESYVEWAGGEENARAVMGDERFEELVRVEAEKAEEDRRLRSAR